MGVAACNLELLVNQLRQPPQFFARHRAGLSHQKMYFKIRAANLLDRLARIKSCSKMRLAARLDYAARFKTLW